MNLLYKFKFCKKGLFEPSSSDLVIKLSLLVEYNLPSLGP